jgi:hypothetical protein
MISNSDLKKCLNEIYSKHGVITAKIVVAEARVPSSPLHESFEWDVKKAAQRHWEDVANSLIRRVPQYITSDYKKQMRVPCFVRNPMAKPVEQGYVPIDSIERHSASAQIVIAEEIRRIVGAAQRGAAVAFKVGYEELATEIEESLAHISGLGSRLLKRLNEVA